MAKRYTAINADITIRVYALVEHDEDEEVTQEAAEQFVEEMTPDDWFNYYHADPPSIDVDLEELCEDKPAAEEPDIGWKNGRAVNLEAA